MKIIIATIILITITASIPLAGVSQGQITLEPLAPGTTISLNVSYSNGTNATLVNEPITAEQGDLIISAVNTVLAGLVEDLEDLELEEEL